MGDPHTPGCDEHPPPLRAPRGGFQEFKENNSTRGSTDLPNEGPTRARRGARATPEGDGFYPYRNMGASAPIIDYSKISASLQKNAIFSNCSNYHRLRRHQPESQECQVVRSVKNLGWISSNCDRATGARRLVGARPVEHGRRMSYEFR